MGSIPFGSKVGLKLWVGSRSSWSIQRRMCSQELCCNWRKDNWKWFFFVGKWKVLATMGVFRGENLNALSALLLLYFIVSGISGMVWTLTLPFDFLVKSGIWVISDICVNKTNKTKCQDDFVQLGYQSPKLRPREQEEREQCQKSRGGGVRGNRIWIRIGLKTITTPINRENGVSHAIM